MFRRDFRTDTAGAWWRKQTSRTIVSQRVKNVDSFPSSLFSYDTVEKWSAQAPAWTQALRLCIHLRWGLKGIASTCSASQEENSSSTSCAFYPSFLDYLSSNPLPDRGKYSLIAHFNHGSPLPSSRETFNLRHSETTTRTDYWNHFNNTHIRE